MQHDAKHAPDERHIVQRRPIVHNGRTTRRPERGRQIPERRTYHDEFRVSPRHQRGELGSRVLRQTRGPQLRGEVVAFLHAGEGWGCGAFAETGGAVGGDG